MRRHRQSGDAVSACNQHGCWVRSPDGCGFMIPLQWSLDIINVLCVWPNNDPPLIQMQVTRAGESLRSAILKDPWKFFAIIVLCLCKGTFWHRRKSLARLRNGTESSLSFEQLKNILRSSLFLPCHALTLQKQYTKIPFLLLGGGLYLVI